MSSRFVFIYYVLLLLNRLFHTTIGTYKIGNFLHPLYDTEDIFTLMQYTIYFYVYYEVCIFLTCIYLSLIYINTYF